MIDILTAAAARTGYDGRLPDTTDTTVLVQGGWARKTPAGVFLTPTGREQLDPSHPARRNHGAGFDWGRHAYPDPVPKIPTRADVQAHPRYWISGPGSEVASRAPCGHPGGYHLTDSCPNC